MPIRPRKLREKRDRLTIAQEFDLFLSVYSHFSYWPEDSPFSSPEHRRRSWDIHGERLMKEWRENNVPGTRPAAFWDYSAPETTKVKERRSMDKPTICYNTGRVVSDYEIYEDEEDVLKRLGLLEPWEIEALNQRNKIKQEVIHNATE